ncbi:MAG: acyl-CoA thioesterase [Oscillospiraceae bacterium]
MEIKLVKDSYTIMTEIVLQSHVNGTGRLFGGQLMSWMDIAGAICAKRHAGNEVVTAAAHQLEFFRPAMPNDVIVIKAKMLSVGNTSMKVGITVEVEGYGAHRDSMEKTCSAIFVYVAIDVDGTKHRVPRLAYTEEDDDL